MKETMITCTCCGTEVHPEDVIYVGTQPICLDCAETETFVCDHCGFRFWNGDNMGDGRFDLCESCRDEYYVTCSECGHLLRNIEAYYEDSDEDGETPYCEGCYRHKVSDALHSYHPFPGILDGHRETKGPDFALAHNGVLQNDRDLRLRLHLPETTIETDSYVAVQMLEALGTLDLPTLQEVAEQLEGTFTLTLLDRRDTLYFVRGNNPLYLVEFPHLGLFVYASTAEILRDAVSRLDFLRTRLYSPIWLEEGEILSLSADGRMKMRPFRVSPLQYSFSMWDWSYRSASPFKGKLQADLLNTALNMGYEEEDVEILMACGYCDDEIEELLQDPELFRAALRESYYEYAFHGGGALP